ncbi:MAG: hypothetical protein HOW73_47255 [Polyangiaceae bacterium]|nr:hypothetical protein [Polyangiaceae bacterium]
MGVGSIGLVLSGGGARGAYEVGVLAYVADMLPELLGRVRVVTGTSVGAVNAAFLASRGLTTSSISELHTLWSKLAVDDLVSIDRAGVRDLLAAGGKRLVGRAVSSPAVGLLRVEGIAKLVGEHTDWRGLRKVVRSRRLDAVGFAATDIATGRTCFFVDYADGIEPRWPRGDESPIPERAALGPAHVLASAAIPILFPPVAIDGRWFMDGGVRYNTPLAPALSLGAESLLIVSVRAHGAVHQHAPDGEFSGFGQVIGKVLDSVFLDRIAYDLDRLQRINDVVASILATFGARGLADFQAQLESRDRPRYRSVPFAHILPSQDLGALASTHLAAMRTTGPLSFSRVLKALFQDDRQTTGDAASFLLFDGGYTSELLEAGYRDAASNHAALAAL